MMHTQSFWRFVGAGAIFFVSLSTLIVPCRYLTEYGAAKVLGFGLGIIGLTLAAVMARFGHRFVRKPMSVILVSVLLGLPLLSMSLGRVTYARFGLTVYGFIPVPLLDVRIGPTGFLWFRDKTHFLSLAEIQPFLDSGSDIILGTGWDNFVRVDDAIRNLGHSNIHILSTPEAFSLFNRLRSEGRRPVLLAHSTC